MPELIGRTVSACRMFLVERCAGVLPRRWWLRMVVAEGRARGESMLELVAALVAPGTCLLDVGANAGVYVAAGLCAGGDVIAVEPVPALAAKLRSRYPSVTVLEAAAAPGGPASMTLHLPVRDGTEFATRASLSPDANEGFDLRSFPVATDTLDNLVGARVADVALLKVDVEGFEEAVLSSAPALLAAGPCVLVEIECRHHRSDPWAAMRILESAGYVGFFEDPSSPRRLVSAAEFSFERHQSVVKDPSAFSHRRDYVNNFLFLPASRLSSVRASLAACGWVLS